MESAQIVERVARMEGQFSSLDRDLQKHLADCTFAHAENNRRLVRLERVVWQATGATSVLVTVLHFVFK